MDAMTLPLTRGFITRLDSELWESDLTYTFRTGEQFTAKPSSIHWYAPGVARERE